MVEDAQNRAPRNLRNSQVEFSSGDGTQTAAPNPTATLAGSQDGGSSKKTHSSEFDGFSYDLVAFDMILIGFE